MAGWSSTRLAGLRRRAAGLAAQSTEGVPMEVGGPYVTDRDVEAARGGIDTIGAALRDGTATEAQARAIQAVLDANADADTQQQDAAYGAGLATGYQAGYDPNAADYDAHRDPEPDW
jgi:hypothetical protein